MIRDPKYIADTQPSVVPKRALPIKKLTVQTDPLADYFRALVTTGIPDSTTTNQALTEHDARSKIFLAAYGQKSIKRLARVMETLDVIDDTLFEPWRLRSMATDSLIDLMSELHAEKSRSVKELVQIQEQQINVAQEIAKSQPKDQHSGVHTLNAKERGRVLQFVEDRVMRRITNNLE